MTMKCDMKFVFIRFIMKKIEDIPIPEDLTEVQKAEFIAYKSAMIQLEEEWIQLQSDQNPDQIACNEIIQETNDLKKKKILEKLETRRDIIKKQHQKEIEKIEKEFKVAKSTLNDRLIRAYYQSDQNIIAQLKDLKGKDSTTYIAENSIDFPPIPSDSQMKTRTNQPEELKLRLSPQDCEKDIRKIQTYYDSEQ